MLRQNRRPARAGWDGGEESPIIGLHNGVHLTPVPRNFTYLCWLFPVWQGQVPPAMDAAFAAGLEVTGLHDHVLFDEPKVHFTHVGGMGGPRSSPRLSRALGTPSRRSSPSTRRPRGASQAT